MQQRSEGCILEVSRGSADCRGDQWAIHKLMHMFYLVGSSNRKVREMAHLSSEGECK